MVYSETPLYRHPVIWTLVIMECFLGPAPYIFLKINLLNKMPILAFTRDTVLELFPLYALQLFKTIVPSQLKYWVTVLKIIPKISFWKRHDRGRYISDSHAIHGYLYFLFICCITLFEIILEIAFGKRHDLGQIYISDSEDRRQYYC